MSALVKLEQDGLGKDLLDRREDFARALGDALDADRFIQEAFSAVNANPFLRKCTPESLLGALYFAAQLGLPVGGPLQQFHLTPRYVWNPNAILPGTDKRGAKEWQVVPVVGYNGLITLAMNSGEYDAVEGKLVYANDEFEEPWDDEAGTHFKLKPAKGDRGDLIGVVGRALVKGADRSVVEWLDIDTIRKRMRPDNWEKTPWKTDEPAMVKKSGVRRVAKYTSKSIKSHRFALAMANDEAVNIINDLGELEANHDSAPSEDWATLIAATDDKADLEALWKRIAKTESEDIKAEFVKVISAHAATLTKDSRASKDKPSSAEVEAAAVGHEEHDPAEPTDEELDALGAPKAAQ